MEKFYILIDENRKIITRYTSKIHGGNIPNKSIEVTEDIFRRSYQENHNYLNEDSTTCYKEELKTQKELNELRKAEILAELTQIDLKSVRPMSAIIDGTAVEKDRDILRELRASATLLRTELSTL